MLSAWIEHRTVLTKWKCHSEVPMLLPPTACSACQLGDQVWTVMLKPKSCPLGEVCQVLFCLPQYSSFSLPFCCCSLAAPVLMGSGSLYRVLAGMEGGSQVKKPSFFSFPRSRQRRDPQRRSESSGQTALSWSIASATVPASISCHSKSSSSRRPRRGRARRRCPLSLWATNATCTTNGWCPARRVGSWPSL